MTYEQFQSLVTDMVGKEHGSNQKWHEEPNALRTKLELEWQTGGASGGNCWGDEANYYFEGKPEPEFTDLITVLESVAPNLTFLQFQRLSNDCIIRDSRRAHEYYGKFTDYGTKTIELKKLYDFLHELKYI